ncbi:MAG TPA: hypothetical protein VN495_03860 [Candidatus Paceibacterota bacterium]|nr:hypothetical protein [Candidatus Paceibacterota bacterium]
MFKYLSVGFAAALAMVAVATNARAEVKLPKPNPEAAMAACGPCVVPAVIVGLAVMTVEGGLNMATAGAVSLPNN